MTRKLLFVVNGRRQSAMGIRARGLALGLNGLFDVHFVYRPEGAKLPAARQMAKEIERHQPHLIYVLDLALAGVLAALWYRLRHRAKIVVDTGDAITALARSASLRGPAGIAATWLLEEVGLRAADHVVVRGSRHREYLAEKKILSTWIPDGFENDLFYPPSAIQRSEYLTIGLLGSVIWGGDVQSTYGWDLVETLALLPDLPLRGLLVGDGSGLARLRSFADRRGVGNRMEYAGRIPYEHLRASIHRMDICLSTQTNDLPGQVRTTGKLPLYVACGRFILASRVGEAGRLLPASMLVDYDGSRDSGYPAKLASRIRNLHNEGLNLHEEGCRIANELSPLFEYTQLSAQVSQLLQSL